MEGGIAFSVTMGLLFSLLRYEERAKRVRIIGFSVIGGVLAAALSAYLRSIPNFLNRTALNFYSMLPVVGSMLLLLLLILFGSYLRKKQRKAYEILLSLAVVLYSLASFFSYLPLIMTNVSSFVSYGESAVSTAGLFRVIG